MFISYRRRLKLEALTSLVQTLSERAHLIQCTLGIFKPTCKHTGLRLFPGTGELTFKELLLTDLSLTEGNNCYVRNDILNRKENCWDSFKW